ncbi:MAG: GTP-binding protein [Lentisphaeria bacterium]|nr:MAG: GTP-binding protein [Lentisphaeria bacterium]
MEKRGRSPSTSAHRPSTTRARTSPSSTPPGHAAFTSMRARGANVTDLVILVVSATEGFKPQTVEAMNHALAAKVPIIVAINKIDLPDADPDKVLLHMQQHNLSSEDWGGTVGTVRVSAKTGKGLPDLLERILIEAEMLELKANPRRPASGVVLEAQLENGLGPTASVLVQDGTLRGRRCRALRRTLRQGAHIDQRQGRAGEVRRSEHAGQGGRHQRSTRSGRPSRNL